MWVSSVLYIERKGIREGKTFLVFHVVDLSEGGVCVVGEGGEDDRGGHSEGEVGGVVVIRDRRGGWKVRGRHVQIQIMWDDASEAGRVV